MSNAYQLMSDAELTSALTELESEAAVLKAKNLSHGRVDSFDLIIRAEIDDLSGELREVIELLPAGTYAREQLCDQLNSIICAHGWATKLGTVA